MTGIKQKSEHPFSHICSETGTSGVLPSYDHREKLISLLELFLGMNPVFRDDGPERVPLPVGDHQYTDGRYSLDVSVHVDRRSQL